MTDIQNAKMNHPVTGMTFEREISRWRSNLARMSRNISDLGELLETPEMAPIRMRLNRPLLSPATATDKMAQSWSQTSAELWECTKLVGEFIDRADTVVKAAWPWQKDEAERTAIHMLYDNQIELAGGSVPVLRRGLLGNVEDVKTLSLTEMMNFMEEGFTRGKQSLEILIQSKKSLDVLMTDVINRAEKFNLSAIIEHVGILLLRADDDPVGMIEEMQMSVIPALNELEKTTYDARLKNTEATQRMAEVRQEVVRLRTMAIDADKAMNDASIKVKVITDKADRKILLELAAWSDRLDRILNSGRLDAWRIGMENWNVMAKSLTSAFQNEIDAAHKAIFRREELRNRFDALMSKRNVRLKAGIKEEAEVAQTIEELSACLTKGIMDIQNVERLMLKFEEHIFKMKAR